MSRPKVAFEILDGAPVARVPLLGPTAGARTAIVDVDVWHRIGRFEPFWYLIGEGDYEAVVASRRDDGPTFTNEMVARLVAWQPLGWAVLTRNGDATDLRRCNLYLRNVETGARRPCPMRRPRHVIEPLVVAA